MAGMTGHRDLHDSATSGWVSEAIGRALDEWHATCGICCLAIGADQLFAEQVLRRELELTAVLPSRRYEETFRTEHELTRYRALVARSSAVVALEHEHNSSQAFLAGGRAVVDAAAVLLAVWDGQPARGAGGTADIVSYARGLGRRVVHIDPIERSVTTST